MELHSLKPASGSTKKRKRIARGQGSGHGGTSTRGHKGQKSRSGYSRKRNFEGGQMPLSMRIPKRGFKNPNRVEYVPLNLSRLETIAKKYNETTLNLENLISFGIIRAGEKIKVLAGGSLTTKLEISVHACSEAAKKSIETAGGTLNLV